MDHLSPCLAVFCEPQQLSQCTVRCLQYVINPTSCRSTSRPASLDTSLNYCFLQTFTWTSHNMSEVAQFALYDRLKKLTVGSHFLQHAVIRSLGCPVSLYFECINFPFLSLPQSPAFTKFQLPLMRQIHGRKNLYEPGDGLHEHSFRAGAIGFFRAEMAQPPIKNWPVYAYVWGHRGQTSEWGCSRPLLPHSRAPLRHLSRTFDVSLYLSKQKFWLYTPLQTGCFSSVTVTSASSLISWMTLQCYVSMASRRMFPTEAQDRRCCPLS